MKNGLTRIRQQGLALKVGALTLALLLLYAAVAWVAYRSVGTVGMIAAGVAATICLVPAWAALAISTIFQGPRHALPGLLLAMLVRTGGPLLFALLILRKGPLADAGAVYYLVVFYLAALGFETWLSLPVAGATDAVSGTGRDTLS